MKKFYSSTTHFLLLLVGLFVFSGSLHSQVIAVPIQMPECDVFAPGYQIDLSAYPAMEFLTPEVSQQIIYLPYPCGLYFVSISSESFNETLKVIKN